MPYGPFPGKPKTADRKRSGLPVFLAVAGILSPGAAFVLSMVLVIANSPQKNINFTFPYLLSLFLLAVPVAAIALGLRRRKTDKRYNAAWIVGAVVLLPTLFAALIAVMPGMIFEGGPRTEGGERSGALFEAYGQTAGVAFPDPSNAYLYICGGERADLGADDPGPGNCAVSGKNTLTLNDPETAAAFWEQVAENGLWVSPLSNSLYGATPTGVHTPTTRYYSGKKPYRYQSRVLVFDRDAGVYNAAPTAPGVYRFIAVQYTFCENTDTGEPVYGYLELYEYTVNYIG